MGGVVSKTCENCGGTTLGRHMILRDYSNGGGGGIRVVAERGVDIERNTRDEGGFLDIKRR